MDNSIKSNDSIIVFCQAPADIPYFLTLYEKHKDKNEISLYVINVENVYNFIDKLNLKLHAFVFIPYSQISLTNLKNVLSERGRIKGLINRYFIRISSSNVYFFSRFEDWLTAAFLSNLSKRNSIYYIDYYDFSSELFERKKMNLKMLVLRFVYYVLTGAFFKLEVMEKMPEFQYQKYNVSKQVLQVEERVFYNYRYEFESVPIKGPTVLFFISPCEDSIYDCKTHDEIQLLIIQSFKRNKWNVIVKGHPRIGIPENITGLVDYQIPSYIPAEFVHVDNVSMCVGIITAALSHFATKTRIPTYSLINLFQFKEQNFANNYKQYLCSLSDDNVKYFEDYENFEKIIKDRDGVW